MNSSKINRYYNKYVLYDYAGLQDHERLDCYIMKANSRSFVKVHQRGRYHSFSLNIPPKQRVGSFVVHDRNQRLF